MAAPDPLRATPRRILRMLAAGFLLVVLLLGFATYVALRESGAIQSNSAGLLAGHLQTARLIDALEAEQHRMDRLLFHLSQGRRRAPSRESLLEEVAAIREAVGRAVAITPPTAARERWEELATVSQRFADAAAVLIQSPSPPREDALEELFSRHEHFVDLIGELVKEDAARSIEIEGRIERQSRLLGGEAKWILGGCFLLALICAGVTIAFTLVYIRRMEVQGDVLNRVSWQMLQGQEVAARRFAHEMHDELGQCLAGLRAVLTTMKPEDVSSRRSDCVRLVDGAISNVRELSQLLRPVILDDFGLSSALRWLCEGFAERTKIDVECAPRFQDRLADETETHLFRITQEALTNIARHSSATRARIQLWERDGFVHLEVEDNGKGFPQAALHRPSIGLLSIRARARQAGGDVNFGTSPLGGASIEVWVPARKATQDAEQEDTYTLGG
jgi:signal transduction histidine kinase